MSSQANENEHLTVDANDQADTATNEDAKLWDLPTVEDPDSPYTEKSEKTTAYNKPFTQWKFEAPEEEQELAPLTAEDIEAIRSAAFEEGFENGQKAGFDKGFEDGVEQGKQAGFEQGKEEGSALGKQEADEQAKVQLQALASLTQELQQPLAQVNEELKKELVILATNLARAVIKVEISQSPESLLNIINESIAVLPLQDTHYQIMMHEDDIQMLKAHLGDEAIASHQWELRPCAEQGRGGCKVLSEHNAVDMSIARRCESIFGQLLSEQGLSDDPRAS